MTIRPIQHVLPQLKRPLHLTQSFPIATLHQRQVWNNKTCKGWKEQTPRLYYGNGTCDGAYLAQGYLLQESKDASL